MVHLYTVASSHDGHWARCHCGWESGKYRYGTDAHEAGHAHEREGLR